MFFVWIILLIWGEKDNSLLIATLFSHFSESKESPARINGTKDFRGSVAAAKANYTCVWLIFTCFWRKRIIHFHLQPYSPTFRNRKSGQKIFAAQSPPRKRGFFSTHQTIVVKNFLLLRNFPYSLADAPHCSIMGSVRS